MPNASDQRKLREGILELLQPWRCEGHFDGLGREKPCRHGGEHLTLKATRDLADILCCPEAAVQRELDRLCSEGVVVSIAPKDAPLVRSVLNDQELHEGEGLPLPAAYYRLT